MNKKPKIFIACDTSKISVIKNIIYQSQTNKLEIGFKFGLEFFILKMDVILYQKLKGKIFFRLKT